MQVHPEFDTATKTWFVRGRKLEASTIRVLLEKLSKSSRKEIIVKDYYTDGQRCPIVDYGRASSILPRPMMTHAKSVHSLNFRRRSAKAGSKSISEERMAEIKSIDDKDIDTTEIPEVGEDFFKKAKLVFPTKSRIKTAGRSTGDMPPEMRAELDNQALDLWAQSYSAQEIAAKLDLKVNYIGATLIPRARRLGDPRAGIRNPLKLVPKPKYNSFSSSSGSVND
jgi:hypothetical protein